MLATTSTLTPLRLLLGCVVMAKHRRPSLPIPLRRMPKSALSETVRLDARTKLLNPKWYEGMLSHG